jgi:hypothetical protein
MSMHDLATIQRMNSAIESAKIRRVAKAANSGGAGHAKDLEKGRKTRVARQRDSSN